MWGEQLASLSSGQLAYLWMVGGAFSTFALVLFGGYIYANLK